MMQYMATKLTPWMKQHRYIALLAVVSNMAIYWQCLYNSMQTLKSCEVPYFLLALYEKATLSRTTDNPASRINDDVK